MSETTKIEAFTKALKDMSYSRAGWDYQMSATQRAQEAALEREARDSARAIWAENPGMHNDLRAAFTTLSPLATMSEIEQP